MPNLCPICQVPIRKNAKHCTLHAIQRDLSLKDANIAKRSNTKTGKNQAREHRRKVALARQQRTLTLCTA
jgi:hypothetical protein